MKLKIQLPILLAFLAVQPMFSQENHKSFEGEKGKLKLSAALGSAFIHYDLGNDLVKKAPAFAIAINADYFVWNEFGFGLHSDITFRDFLKVTETGTGVAKDIEKSRPFALAPVVNFQPFKKWFFFTGPGWEFSKEETEFFYRIGTDFGIEIPKDWELVIGADYDIKKGDNNWLFAFGISKIFQTRRKN